MLTAEGTSMDAEYVPPKPLPQYAVLNGIGRCRVLYYHGNGYFVLLARGDVEYFRHRDNLTFLPAKRKD